jgi:hypothetical protein
MNPEPFLRFSSSRSSIILLLKGRKIEFILLKGDQIARYAGPRCRKCCQLGFSVCGSERCALERRTTPPGMHPKLRRKTSDFKKHLLEKQKLRLSYWISEKQFRNYVKKAL